MEMGLLSDDVKEKAKEVLEGMEEDIKDYLFTSEDCKTCEENIKLAKEISNLNDKVKFESNNLESEIANKYNAGKYEGAPVSVITRGGIDGVRYYGIPSGQEFQSFLNDLVTVSRGNTDLDEKVKKELKKINQDVNLKVFVTPQCPYCPKAVRIAHKFAVENENITGEMIEAQEFMDLARDYGVSGVPQVNINGRDGEFTGAYPAERFLDEIKEAIKED